MTGENVFWGGNYYLSLEADMNVVQTIDMMTTAEKILAMEKIWDDLCRTENVVSSPSWHDEVLRAREKMIEVGEDRFVDWNAAKRDIKRKLS